MRASKQRRAISLAVAAQWHSSGDPGGLLMLSLSSTRTVHNEDHRQGLIDEIRADITSLLGPEFHDESPAEIRKDIVGLLDLWELVEDAQLGKEWLTDSENMVIQERLYQEGKL
jgi:hypothetical protein